MASILIRISLVALLAASAAFSEAQGPALSFTDAVQLALSQSRLLDAGGLQASGAREMGVAADQLPDPVLKLGINNLPINGDDRFNLTRDFMTMRSVGVMQEFTREDKRRARSMRFEKEAEVAESTRDLVSINIQRGAATAWLDRYFLERMVNLLSTQHNEAKLQIEAADAAYRGGRGTQVDVFAARSSAAQIEDRIAIAQRQVEVAKTQLERWVGKAAEQMLSGPPFLATLRFEDANLESHLQHFPQISVLLKQEEMAQVEVDLARANMRSDWSAEIMFNQRGPAFSNMISINVSLPFQWDQQKRQDRELAAKQATALQRRAERDDAVRAHVAEIRALLREWHGNRARLSRYDESIVPLSAERTLAAMAAYRGGTVAGGTLSAVLEARRGEIEVRMERLKLEMDTARLWAQINFLTPAGVQP